MGSVGKWGWKPSRVSRSTSMCGRSSRRPLPRGTTPQGADAGGRVQGFEVRAFPHEIDHLGGHLVPRPVACTTCSAASATSQADSTCADILAGGGQHQPATEESPLLTRAPSHRCVAPLPRRLRAMLAGKPIPSSGRSANRQHPIATTPAATAAKTRAPSPGSEAEYAVQTFLSRLGPAIEDS